MKVASELNNYLSMYIGEDVKYEIIETEQANNGDWFVIKYIFENFFQARKCILSLGGAVECWSLNR
jgi:hypothetical protein